MKEMLDVGQLKVARAGLSERIRLLRGDALSLPFADNSFDVAGMAFGIRNIPDRLRALREMTRVVIPGGRIMVLEMAFTPNWFSNLIYHTYLNRILPRIARRFSSEPARVPLPRRFDHEFPHSCPILRTDAGCGHGGQRDAQADLRRDVPLYRKKTGGIDGPAG